MADLFDVGYLCLVVNRPMDGGVQRVWMLTVLMMLFGPMLSWGDVVEFGKLWRGSPWYWGVVPQGRHLLDVGVPNSWVDCGPLGKSCGQVPCVAQHGVPGPVKV